MDHLSIVGYRNSDVGRLTVFTTKGASGTELDSPDRAQGDYSYVCRNIGSGEQFVYIVVGNG